MTAAWQRRPDVDDTDDLRALRFASTHDTAGHNPCPSIALLRGVHRILEVECDCRERWYRMGPFLIDDIPRPTRKPKGASRGNP